MAIGEDQGAPLDETVSNETTQADAEWPVAEQYRIEPPEVPPDEPAVSESAESGAIAPVAEASAATSPRRKFPPDVGPGLLVALLAVLALIGVGAWFATQASGTSETSSPGLTAPATQSTDTTPTTPRTSAVTKPLPDLAGVSLDEARALLERADLRVRVRQASSDRRAGEVVAQDPTAGTEVKPGSLVVLTVSKGETANIATTPKVVGLRTSAATDSIRQANLRPRVRLVTSTRPPGTVVAQSPSPGNEMVEGSTVRLDVAKVPPAIQVPDVVGSTRADARIRLRALGLTSTVVPVTSSEPAGTVVGQSPRAGAKLRKEATVSLRISTGPALTSVPDVTGLDEASARAELQGAGFEVRVAYEPTTDPAQDGIVARQDPAGGTSADEGAVVTITIFQLG